MTESLTVAEVILRGASAGTSLLLAAALAVPGPGAQTRRIGALFSIFVACYILLTRDATKAVFGWMIGPAIFFALNGTVVFWWFAARLFDDGFRWRWWRFAPIVFLTGSYLLRQMIGDASAFAFVLFVAHITANFVMFADAFRLALTDLRDDLVEPRRRFRVVVASVIGLFGLTIAVAEMIELGGPLPEAVFMTQAVVVMALNLFFGAWMLAPRENLFAEAPASASPELAAPSGLSAAEQRDFDRLTALMEAGVYREDGLTVAALAERVGAPEHQLRKLINGALGYRNFSAFLNARRIADAKTMLSDPENARRQVLQIALDLGYGSIAPFNRAFKQATGQTPTEFRKATLGER